MTTARISEQDTLRLRDRAVGATGISILIADARLPDAPIVDVNPAFEQVTGYSTEYVLGRNCRFLQGSGSDPEAVTRIRIALEDARNYTEVLLNYRRDGTPFWNEINVSPVYDREGSLTHFIGLQQDVTRRERANRQLQLLGRTSDMIGSGDPTGDILKSIPDAMVPDFSDYCTVHLQTEDEPIAWLSTVGVDPTVAREIERLECSMPHRLDGDSGISTVMRIGTSIHRQAPSEEMLHETGRNEVHRNLLQQHDWKATLIVPIKTFDSVLGTLHFSRIGPSFPFSAEDVNLAESIGGRIGSLYGNTILTERAQAALVARERFLSIAAHELRTPVASIKGYAQLLSRSLDRGTLTQHRLRQAIQTVDASVARLSFLTDDLLDVSRNGSEELPLRIERIHTVSFLASVVSRSAMLYDHPVVVDSSSAEGHFQGDVSRIDQVMSNLLSNAAKYSDSDQPITIEAETDHDGVRITVRDIGVGLTEEELKTIFELFAGSARPPAPQLCGLGLGLFISRNIIERHGGKLWAESAGLGHGSSITFWLPASSPLTPPIQRDPDRDTSVTEHVENEATLRQIGNTFAD